MERLNSWLKTSIESIKVGEVYVKPVNKVRNLGTWFDTNLMMNAGINKTCSNAFFYLYNIKHIYKYLTCESAAALVHAFITSRVDYCNSLYYGLPYYHLHKLQRVLNSSARLVLCAPRICHITPLSQELHWLPVRSHIEFKLLLITFKVLKGLAPLYLSELISVLPLSSYNLGRNYNGTLLCTLKFKSKKTLRDPAFSSAAPALWNSLPLAIRMLTSLSRHLRRNLRPIYSVEFLLSDSRNSFCTYLYLFKFIYKF